MPGSAVGAKQYRIALKIAKALTGKMGTKLRASPIVERTNIDQFSVFLAELSLGSKPKAGALGINAYETFAVTSANARCSMPPMKSIGSLWMSNHRVRSASSTS